jgi:hypothetical protein
VSEEKWYCEDCRDYFKKPKILGMNSYCPNCESMSIWKKPEEKENLKRFYSLKEAREWCEENNRDKDEIITLTWSSEYPEHSHYPYGYGIELEGGEAGE